MLRMSKICYLIISHMILFIYMIFFPMKGVQLYTLTTMWLRYCVRLIWYDRVVPKYFFSFCLCLLFNNLILSFILPFNALKQYIMKQYIIAVRPERQKCIYVQIYLARPSVYILRWIWKLCACKHVWRLKSLVTLSQLM